MTVALSAKTPVGNGCHISGLRRSVWPACLWEELLVMRVSPDAPLAASDSYPAVLFRAAPSGEVVWVNHRWYELSGTTEDAILALAWQQIIHPDDAEEAIARWMQAMETGESFRSEARIRYADGSYHWVHTRAEAQRFQTGEIGFWLGAVVEIDNLKEIERELLKSELRFRALTDNVDQIIFVADERWNVTYVNRRFEEYTGIAAHEAYGSGWLRAMPGSETTYVEAELRQADLTGTLKNENQLYHAASKAFRWNAIRAHRVSDVTGEHVQWFGTITDVHDQKVTLQKKNEALDAFQLALLPRHISPIPGCDVSTLYVSASEEARVGGDWYDVFDLGEARYGISIGDVVGHGLEASAAMSRTRQYILPSLRKAAIRRPSWPARTPSFCATGFRLQPPFSAYSTSRITA